MATPSQAYQQQIALASTGTAIGSFSAGYDVELCDLHKEGEHLESDGLRGTRSRISERVRAGISRVVGQIALKPSPLELDILFPWILGAAESTDTFALADTLPGKAVAIDRGAKRYVYDGVYVDRATFNIRPGSLVELILDLIGDTETETGTSMPSLTFQTDAAYTIGDAVFTFVSAARDTFEGQIVIENFLDPQFINSTTVGNITPRDRRITVRTKHPFSSDETSLYGQAVGGSAGTIVLTNGGVSTTFTFGRLQVPDNTARARGAGRSGEITTELEMVARMVSTTKELVVTHDSAA